MSTIAIACPNCNGGGHVVCPECGGSGGEAKTMAGETIWSPCFFGCEDGKRTCPMCHGKGEVTVYE
jgi:RecJ-like exonuclease